MASDALLEAVRALRVAEPSLGVKPMAVRLREQQPELAVGAKEVREALKALEAEKEAEKEAAASAAPTRSGSPSREAPPLAAGCCPRYYGGRLKRHRFAACLHRPGSCAMWPGKGGPR